jgi:flagellar protein FliO/FliZ
MFEALFGIEMPFAVRIVVALIIVLALIGGAAYLVRRFGTTALNAAAAARGRQPRLAVIDIATVDGRRRLMLIRRDNVEHLVMIGGPTDVVIEPNIVRAIPTTPARDPQPSRISGPVTDMLPRAVPLGETGTWPLQPEPAPRPQRAPAPVAAQDDSDWSAQAEPAPRAQSADQRMQNPDRLAGLAADLSRSFHDTEAAPPQQRGAPTRRTAAQPQVVESEEQNLAEMAHRLENALQRPRQTGEGAAPVSATAPARGTERADRGERPERAERTERPERTEPVVVAVRPDGKPAPKPTPKGVAKPGFDSLEQEMASLLGRPAAKT